MKMLDESQDVTSMDKLFREAREKKLWFFTNYQQIWFSPDELEKQNAQGKFLWGAVNWKLRNPIERLKELDENIVDAQNKRSKFVARLLAEHEKANT